MPVAFRFWVYFCLGLACVSDVPEARAQIEAPASESSVAATGSENGDELRLIRRLLEIQSNQIEALTQEVTELRAQIDRLSPRATAAQPPAVTQDLPPLPAQTPAESVSLPPVPSPPAPPTGPTHAIAAGETLTAIARRYNTTVAKLMELNNIQDDRKLQIGQLLILPNTAPQPQRPPSQETP